MVFLFPPLFSHLWRYQHFLNICIGAIFLRFNTLINLWSKFNFLFMSYSVLRKIIYSTQLVTLALASKINHFLKTILGRLLKKLMYLKAKVVVCLPHFQKGKGIHNKINSCPCVLFEWDWSWALVLQACSILSFTKREQTQWDSSVMSVVCVCVHTHTNVQDTAKCYTEAVWWMTCISILRVWEHFFFFSFM